MARRVMAIIGIVLIVGLYLAALFLAIFGNENTTRLFIAAIVATIVVPILLYAYRMLMHLGDKNK